MTIEEIEQSIASYGEDVFRFCCYLTGNRSSAEDLYQDTFLKAMEITRPVEPDMAGKVSGRRSSQSLEKSVAQGKTQTEICNAEYWSGKWDTW